MKHISKLVIENLLSIAVGFGVCIFLCDIFFLKPFNGDIIWFVGAIVFMAARYSVYQDKLKHKKRREENGRFDKLA